MNKGLFLGAFAGVLLIAGLALSALSPWALLPYGLLLTVAARPVVRRARAVQQPAGRTCQCCTSTVYDPVEVR